MYLKFIIANKLTLIWQFADEFLKEKQSITQRNRRTQRISDYVRLSKSNVAIAIPASNMSSSTSLNFETSSLVANTNLTSDMEQFQINYHISDLKNR